MSACCMAAESVGTAQSELQLTVDGAVLADSAAMH